MAGMACAGIAGQLQTDFAVNAIKTNTGHSLSVRGQNQEFMVFSPRRGYRHLEIVAGDRQFLVGTTQWPASGRFKAADCCAEIVGKVSRRLREVCLPDVRYTVAARAAR